MHKLHKLIVIISLVFVTNICAADRDQLIVDKYLSPYVGTALNLSILHTYTFLDDEYLPSSDGQVTVLWSLGRILKLGVEDVLSEYIMVFQHEVFGHGYRLREFGFTGVQYYIGLGHGFTAFDDTIFDTLPYPKRAAISAAGMEANAVLSQQIRENWIYENKVDRRDAWLYFVTSVDQSEYILLTNDNDTSEGNDINSYVSEINAWYGNTALTKHKLRSYAIWDLFDPSLYIGLYAIGDYIVRGTPHISMPRLNVHGYKYMLSPRLLLTPYGPEFQIQNYVVTPKHELLQINLRYGNNSHTQSYGLDFFMRPIWRYKKINFGNKLYLWRQPEFLKGSTAQDVSNGLGIADFVAVEYKFFQGLAAYGEFGYKTVGYIQGIPLGNSWVWRIGLSLYH